MSEKQWTLFRISIPNVILGTHINPTVIHRFSEIQMAVTPVLCPATSLWEFDHEEGRRRRKKGKVTFGSQNGFFSKTWFQLENIGKAYLQKHFKPSIVTYLKNVPIGEVGVGQRWKLEGALISLWRETHQAFEWPLGSLQSPPVYQENLLIRCSIASWDGVCLLIRDSCLFSLCRATVKCPWGSSAPFSLVSPGDTRWQ